MIDLDVVDYDSLHTLPTDELIAIARAVRAKGREQHKKLLFMIRRTHENFESLMTENLELRKKIAELQNEN